MDMTKTVKDALYVGIGLGVIGFQKAQVRRQELTQQLKAQASDFDGQVAEIRSQLTRLAKDVEARFEPVIDELDTQLDKVEELLPEQARDVVKQARAQAKDLRLQLRSRLATAA